MLSSERYTKSDCQEELKAILEDVGVYSAVDLTDVDSKFIAAFILPLLKMAPRNRIVKLLGMPTELISAGRFDSLYVFC